MTGWLRFITTPISWSRLTRKPPRLCCEDGGSRRPRRPGGFQDWLSLPRALLPAGGPRTAGRRWPGGGREEQESGGVTWARADKPKPKRVRSCEIRQRIAVLAAITCY